MNQSIIFPQSVLIQANEAMYGYLVYVIIHHNDYCKNHIDIVFPIHILIQY